MDVINVLIGILLNILGIFLIKYYLSLVKKKQPVYITINLLGAGIMFLMIGIALIYNEIKHFF